MSMITQSNAPMQEQKADYYYYELHEFTIASEKDQLGLDRIVGYTRYCNQKLKELANQLEAQTNSMPLLQATTKLWQSYMQETTWLQYAKDAHQLAHLFGKQAAGLAIDLRGPVFLQTCENPRQTGWIDRDGSPWLDWLAMHDPEHAQDYQPVPLRDVTEGYAKLTINPQTRRKIVLNLHKIADWDSVNSKWTDPTILLIPGTAGHYWAYSRHSPSLSWLHKHHSVKPGTPAITVTNHSIEVSGVDKYDSNLKPRPAEELAWHWDTDKTMQKLQAAFQTEWAKQPSERNPRILVQALGELKRYADHRAWVTLNTLVEEPVAGVKVVDKTTTDFAKSLVYRAADSAERRQIPVQVVKTDE